MYPKNTAAALTVQPRQTAQLAFSPEHTGVLMLEVPGNQCADAALRLSRRLTAGLTLMLQRIGDAINEAGDGPSAEEVHALAYLSESAAALISAVERGLLGAGGEA